MNTKAKKLTSPLLALAFATLAERKNEPRRFAAAIRKASNLAGFRSPKRREFISEIITELRGLTRHLQWTLANTLEEHGAELVQDEFFQDYLLNLQTGHLHQLVSACIWADYLAGKKIAGTSDPRAEMLHNLEHTLRLLLSRRQKSQPKMAQAAA